MKAKKNPKSDLEKSKSVFFLIGLLVALFAVFAAFNISTTVNFEELKPNKDLSFEDDEIQPIRTEVKPKITPPPPKQVIEVLSIVDDDENVEDSFLEIDAGADENMRIELIQTITPIKEKDEYIEILDFAAVSPKFPGGDIGLQKYLGNNTKYPEIARQNRIEGKIFVRFCVTKTGKVEKVSIARGVDPILDKEAIRVVKTLPDWKPGENGGRKVNVWYTVPIHFQIK